MTQPIYSSGVLIFSAAGGLCLLGAAAHDVATRTVPNWVPLVVALAGLLARIADGNPLSGLASGSAVFVLAAILWRCGLMGGADVKLLGAAAIVVPPGLVITFIAAMSIAGGLLGLVYLLGRTLPGPVATPRPRSMARRILRIERWRLHRGGPLPYACAIAAGCFFVLVQSGGGS